MGAWGGYSNGQIPESAMASLQGQWFEPQMFQAMVSFINECAAQGVDVSINEGYRPLGEPGDQYITDESQTSTGGSNQWFQYGRMNRGETPSAATPGGSSHGWGQAADIYPGCENGVVASVAASLGLSFPIGSENWHIQFTGGSPAPVISVDYKEVQTLLAGRGYYSGAIDGQFGPASWTAVQTLCADAGFMDVAYIDGVPGSRTYTGMQLYGQKNGNYPGRVDGIVGPNTWAGFVQSLREDAPKTPPAPAPSPKPVPAPTPVPEPVKPTPAKPVKPIKPVPSKPVPSKPKEPTVPTIKPLPDAANTAATDSLGILIPDAKNRKLAYALYGLASLVISNVAVGVLASGIQAPVWLVVALAIVGNLAAPFSTLAIANAGIKK